MGCGQLVLEPLQAHADIRCKGMQLAQVGLVGEHVAAWRELATHDPTVAAQRVDVDGQCRPKYQCLAPDPAAGAAGAVAGAVVLAAAEAGAGVAAGVVDVAAVVEAATVDAVAGVLSMALVIDFDVWSIA
jgi:hypothetical protein